QVEELTYQLRQLEEQLRRMQEDNEFRFRDLEGGSGGSGGAAPGPRSDAAPPSSTGSPALALPDNPQPPGNEVPDAIGSLAGAYPDAASPGLGTPPQPLGTLTLDPSLGDQPLDLTAPAGPSGGPNVAAINPSGDARTDYE